MYLIIETGERCKKPGAAVIWSSAGFYFTETE